MEIASTTSNYGVLTRNTNKTLMSMKVSMPSRTSMPTIIRAITHGGMANGNPRVLAPQTIRRK